MSIKKQLIKLIIFAVVTSFCSLVLAATIGNLSTGASREVKAEFTDVTGLVNGDDVRIAGVRVGSIKSIDLTGRSIATVTFSVDSAVPLTDTARADLRYRNIVGQRYLALVEGSGSTTELADDATIPVERTTNALDLTTLFNGFKPLFKALSPDDTNKLAFEIVKTLQGEGGTVNALLVSTASLTSTLADRDAVIGRVINQLNDVLSTIDQRNAQFDDLVVTLQQFVSGLAADRTAIGSSLQNISDVAASTAGLLDQIRPELKGDIDSLQSAAAALGQDDPNQSDPFLGDDLEGVLQRAPGKLNAIIGTATYGSWFNFFICKADGTLTLSTGQQLTVAIPDNTADRCTSPKGVSR